MRKEDQPLGQREASTKSPTRTQRQQHLHTMSTRKYRQAAVVLCHVREQLVQHANVRLEHGMGSPPETVSSRSLKPERLS